MREIGIDCGDADARSRIERGGDRTTRPATTTKTRETRRRATFGARDCGFETVCEKSVDGTRSIVGDEQRFTGGVAQESCRNERDEIEDASKDADDDDDDEHTNREAKPSVRASIALADRVVHERARNV